VVRRRRRVFGNFGGDYGRRFFGVTFMAVVSGVGAF
jgi:hypothetical protein